MNHEPLIINGIRYIPETTEPVKQERPSRLRRRIYLNGDNFMCAITDPMRDGRMFTKLSHDDGYNMVEFYDGEIIISKEDFDRADRKCFVDQPHTGPLSANYVERLKRELFK
jgi:hypothetical protein